MSHSISARKEFARKANLHLDLSYISGRSKSLNSTCIYALSEMPSASNYDQGIQEPNKELKSSQPKVEKEPKLVSVSVQARSKKVIDLEAELEAKDLIIVFLLLSLYF